MLSTSSFQETLEWLIVSTHNPWSLIDRHSFMNLHFLRLSSSRHFFQLCANNFLYNCTSAKTCFEVWSTKYSSNLPTSSQQGVLLLFFGTAGYFPSSDLCLMNVGWTGAYSVKSSWLVTGELAKTLSTYFSTTSPIREPMQQCLCISVLTYFLASNTYQSNSDTSFYLLVVGHSDQQPISILGYFFPYEHLDLHIW